MAVINFFKQGFLNLFAWIKKNLLIREFKAKQDDVQAEIDSRLHLIGKEVYHQRGNLPPNDPSIQSICREIADLEQQLLALEQKILSAQKQKNATVLGRTEVSFVSEEEKSIVCKKCKALLPDYATFCPQCGRRTIAEEIPEIADREPLATPQKQSNSHTTAADSQSNS